MGNIAHMAIYEHTGGIVPPLEIDMRCIMARRYAGLEQAQLAEMKAGLSRKTIGNYESGRVRPRRAGLIAIAFATGVDLEWLETGKTPGGNNPNGGNSGGPSGTRTPDPLIKSLGRSWAQLAA